MDNVDESRQGMNKLCVEVEVHSSDSSSDDRELEDNDDAREAAPPAWSVAGGGIGNNNNRRRLLSKQLSMKETTREAKWEKRRRQIQRRSSMVSVVGAEQLAGGERNKSPVTPDDEHQVTRSSSARERCLTDEDLDELRGSFELGFGFDEESGGADLRDTLPALDFYFAVNRQLSSSDPKLIKTLAASPTSTLSAVSSSTSSTFPDTPSPRSPNADSAADTWKIFNPGDHPQLVKTRLRHWAQVVACSVKHGCC